MVAIIYCSVEYTASLLTPVGYIPGLFWKLIAQGPKLKIGNPQNLLSL